MSEQSSADISQQILILAPTGRDGDLACEVLRRNGVDCTLCRSIDEVIDGIDNHAGAAMITEEALDPDSVELLCNVLDRQPKWSEFPIMIFTSETDVDIRARSLHGFSSRANITLVDRPIKINTLVSASRSTLRARQHQYEVRDLLEELEQRIRERDQFLAMLGHELRNPLYAIVLASEESEDNPQEAQQKLEIIRRQGKRLQRLVDDLLDISRVTRGKIELERHRMDLRKFVERVVREMTPVVENQKRSISLEISNGAPMVASIDEIRMEQVLTNLVTNSVKYTPEGGHITVRVEREDGSVLISVSDDGDGIASDVLPHVFDLFAQARTRTDVHQGGLGIGLTLVKNMVELHGGEVSASSDGEGSGTEMVVRIPLAEGAEEEEESAFGTDEPDQLEKVGLRILLVEDNDDIRRLLVTQLRRDGHEVFEASNGKEGVDLAIEHEPSVAIIDIGLPGIDGHEVARRLRSETGDDIYLAAVTGYGQPSDREKALEAGFDEHLAKPVRSRDLERLIARSRKRARSGAEVAEPQA